MSKADEGLTDTNSCYINNRNIYLFEYLFLVVHMPLWSKYNYI